MDIFRVRFDAPSAEVPRKIAEERSKATKDLFYLDPVHLSEDLFSLAFDLHSDLVTYLVKLMLNIIKGLSGGRDVYYHHHIKVAAHYGLGNIKDIDVICRKIGAYLGDDAYCILSDYCDYYFFHALLYLINIKILRFAQNDTALLYLVNIKILRYAQNDTTHIWALPGSPGELCSGQASCPSVRRRAY